MSAGSKADTELPRVTENNLWWFVVVYSEKRRVLGEFQNYSNSLAVSTGRLQPEDATEALRRKQCLHDDWRSLGPEGCSYHLDQFPAAGGNHARKLFRFLPNSISKSLKPSASPLFVRTSFYFHLANSYTLSSISCLNLFLSKLYSLFLRQFFFLLS